MLPSPRLCALAEEEETPPKEPKEEKVTKLNGMSLFGIIEVTDDYTIRVKSDSGIQNIPMAMLGKRIFKNTPSKRTAQKMENCGVSGRTRWRRKRTAIPARRMMPPSKSS